MPAWVLVRRGCECGENKTWTWEWVLLWCGRGDGMDVSAGGEGLDVSVCADQACVRGERTRRGRGSGCGRGVGVEVVCGIVK